MMMMMMMTLPIRRDDGVLIDKYRNAKQTRRGGRTSRNDHQRVVLRHNCRENTIDVHFLNDTNVPLQFHTYVYVTLPCDL